MAPRPSWKGYLKLSLVTCAVELTGATTQAEKVRFKVINRATGNTVRRQYVDAVTGRPVPPEDEVKGYEVGKDEYLLVDDAEIEALQIESSHTLDIESFVDKSAIEQIYLDTPYFVTPADEVSGEAFAVIREAMAQKGKAGLARIVLYRRERPAVIEPLGEGLLLTTLRYAMMVRRPEDVMVDIDAPKLDREMVALAGHIIDQKKGTFDPASFEDRYEKAILDVIRAKQAGKAPPTVRPSGRPSNVVNLFEALRQSLSGSSENGAGGSAEPSAPKRGKASGKPSAPGARKPAPRAAPRPSETPRRSPSRRRSA
ncbi:non-homologous end joining protein Ku [Alsobacter sp. R-9]